MSRVSSIDLREFRDRGRDEYAYADPLEEIGRGRRAERQFHRKERGRHGFGDPVFVQPSSQQFMREGPIITTPSMELQVPPPPPTTRHSRYPPGVYPQYPPQTGYPVGYDPHYLGRADHSQSDMLLLCGAIFLIVCCPFGLCTGIPALFCLCQARDNDFRGNIGESQRSREYSMYMSLCGLFLGIFGFVLTAVVFILLWAVFGVFASSVATAAVSGI